MHSTNIFSAAAFLGMLATTTAHMVIHQPVPYASNHLLNGPLADDGSDFPCKQRPGVYDITTMNNLEVGVPQTLSFMGGATHGGGSCQVSVSLDKEPTQASEWKVIHSIVGGCPSNYSGNLGGDPNELNAATFQYQLPKGMPNGQYTLAWTWFNKIGNREMYMNCAPITVTGGADNNDVFNKLPDMFVINIPAEQCSTVEGEDFDFPNPGDSVETPFSTALGSKTVGSGCAAVTGKGAGKGSAGTAAPASASGGPGGYGSGPASSAATTAPAQASTPPVYSAPPAASQGGLAVQATGSRDSSIVTVTTMATVTSASPSSAAASAPASSAPASSAPAYSAPASSSSNSTTSSGSCSGGSVTCTTPGAVVCIGSAEFGLCDINNCAVPEALASGTTCSNGVIARRSMKHAKRHLAGGRSF